MQKSYLCRGFVIILVGALLDQISKWYIVTKVMTPPQVIKVTSFFNLVLAHNTGVSFSLFNSYGLTGTYVLIGTSSLITLFFLIWLWRANNTLIATGLSLIIGGAVGNVIDRIRLGAVVDFLHFHYQSFSWPAFNLADTFITIGVGLVLIDAFTSSKGDKHA